MIEGLRFDVEGITIQQHCHARAAHHLEMAALAERQVSEMEIARELPSCTTGRLTEAKLRLKGHRNAAEQLQYYGDHIYPAETYRLSMSELNTLEMGV